MFSIMGRLCWVLGRGWVDFGARVRGKVVRGKRVYIAAGAQVIARGNERITIGDNCFVLSGAILACYDGEITIGSNVGINPYAILYGHGGLKIGNNVLIASHTVIIPANHGISRLDIPITKQDLTARGVTIGDDVWLGTRVTVLDGVTIGNGAVLAAGAVVTQDVPERAIAAGVPCKVIGYRTEQGVKYL